MDADRDLNFAIGWNRFNLGLVGIWPGPFQDAGQSDGLSRRRFLIASFFMLGFMCIPQSVNLFFIWGNADMMTENLATANIPVANAFMKAFTIWHYRKGTLAKNITTSVIKFLKNWVMERRTLKPLVGFFYQDWLGSKTSYERTSMLKSASIVRKISIWCTVLTQTMVTIYIVLRISIIIKCQILSAYSATVSYTGSDSFISMLTLHVCGQFQNLREKLKNLADRPGGMKTVEEFRNELAQIVKRHEHLNGFAKTIEDSFNVVLLIQILSCTIQLCFQGFQVFSILTSERDESPTFQLMFLVSFVAFVLVHLYIYCYVGEMLLVQSTEMGFSAYESNWFNVSGKEARNLLFIMRRSTTPLCLTAGKFSVFSLQMFSKIVRTSLGYLSVLLTVTE